MLHELHPYMVCVCMRLVNHERQRESETKTSILEGVIFPMSPLAYVEAYCAVSMNFIFHLRTTENSL